MISGLFTLAAIGSFIGVCWWASARRNAARFDEAAQLPLVDEPATVKAAPAPACCCRESQS
ncbi:MAG: cbb3-type cytochrome c oxidase subunit 3 [Gammaproteobacteria bacterium]|jgi:cytochrome c oxidase cbb3-type subunit 4|uniref:cbb3-type cytochrome oxidase subunit 3 n=1 Tax=Nevskia sp. TaxID=1929292 RepID=UPI003F6FEF6E|nr:cbb3-type cytochrome c oxidase subunit 3 [Gammaproteobacteria bacterium]